jgi:hypothetical protein
LPNIPHAVFANILVLVKGHVEMFETVGFDEFHRLIGIAELLCVTRGTLRRARCATARIRAPLSECAPR